MAVNSASSKLFQHNISEPDKKALSSDGVKAAVDKVASDIKNHASKDVIDRDKSDAYDKYKTAGGQASSLQAFGHEAASLSEDSKAELRQAFNLTEKKETTTPATSATQRGTAPVASSGGAPRQPGDDS